MSVALKLAGFVLVLAAVFGVATVAGGAIDPDRGAESANSGQHGADGGADDPGHGADDADAGADDADHGADDAKRGTDGAAHGSSGAEGGADGTTHGSGTGGHSGADAVRGLSVAEGGLRLVVATPELPARRDARLAFRIVGRDGREVRDFDVEHERRMHLIVARRDLSGFQHLHPRMAADGTWSTPIRIDEPGSYRVFADFSSGGQARTLASDLRVDGPTDLRPLPAPAYAAVSDGGDAVDLRDGGRPLRAGRDATLRFAVERDGAPVQLERYLGAGGHLVALREGDLAFLHVHPTGPAPAAAGSGSSSEDHTHAPGEEHGADAASGAAGDVAARDGAADNAAEGNGADEARGSASGAGNGSGAASDGQVAFETAFPTPGRYRLFLQYQVAGRVETVAFTVEVAQ